MKNKLFGFLFALGVMFGLVFGVFNANYAYAETPSFNQPNGGYGKNLFVTNYDNYVFVADTDNNRIQIVDQATMLAYNFGRGGVLAESTPAPTLLACDNQYMYICMSENNFIKLFDYNGVYQDVFFENYIDGEDTKAFVNIVGMQLDSYNNLYLLHVDEVNKVQLLKKVDDHFVSLDVTLDFDANSKLIISPDTQYIFVVSSTKVAKLNASTYEIIQSYDITIDFDDIKIDYLNNLYFYTKSNNTLTKLSYQDYSTTTTATIEGINQSNGFCFDVISGKAFFVDDSTDSLKQIDCELIESLKDFEKPTDYLDEQLITQDLKIAKVVGETISYNYPYAISSNITLNNNDFVIVLDDSQDFYYCMVTNKRAYNFTVYIHKNNLTLVDLNEYNVSETNYMISTPTALIYKYPTSLSATSTVTSPIALSTPLESGAKVSVTRYLTSFKDYSRFSFYELSFDNGTKGYIASSSIIAYNNQKNPKAIKPNATIKITNERDFINLYTKDGKVISTQVLLNGTRVRLVGNYNKKSELTHIKYIDNNGDVQTAYVKTKYIAMDGITFEIIIAILLVVLCVVLGLMLFVIIKKSRNKV